MKISLCIIYDWLTNYHPELKTTRDCEHAICSEECLQIEDVRLYNHKAIEDRTFLYIGRMSDFFDSDLDNVVCHYTESNLILPTSDIITVFNEILECFFFYNKWHDTVNSKLKQNCTLTEILDLSTNVIQNPMLVLDSSDYLIAATSIYKDTSIDDSWDYLMKNHYSLPDQAFVFHDSKKGIFNKNNREYFFTPEGLFPRKTISHNIYINNEWCGICASFEYVSTFSKGRIHLFKLICSFVEQWFACHVNDAILKQEFSLLTDILSGQENLIENFCRKMIVNGWELTDHLIVTTARPKSERFDTQIYLSKRFNDYSQYIYSVPFNSDLVILCNISKLKPKTFFSFITPWLLKGNYYGGCSYPTSSGRDLYYAYRQSLIPLRFCHPEAGKIYEVKDYAVRWFIEELKKDRAAIPIHPAIRKLADYDQKHHTELMKTLFVYLKNERNIKLSSEELLIHRNTLCQRIERIEDHFKVNLTDCDERIYLLLSLYTTMT